MHGSSDLGIVLFASGDGTGVFSTQTGETGMARMLTNTHFLASDWFDAGRFAALFVTVSGVISASMAGVTVMLERRRRDDGTVLFQPSVIGTRRCDDPLTARSTQQTITRSQLAGQTVSEWPAGAPRPERLDVVLSTAEHRGAGQCRVLLQASGPPDPADRIVVALVGT